VYGELKEGLLLRVPPLLARRLLLPDNPVVNGLGKHFAYEVAVGMNGVVWFSASGPRETVVIRNALLSAKSLSDPEMLALIDALTGKQPTNGASI
jgi:exosome complex component RRP40